MTVQTDEETEERSNSGRSAGLRMKVELWVVAILMAVAFVAGVLVRQDAPSQTSGSTGQEQAPVSEIAPPLSDDQVQSGLPPGHPAIPGATSSPGAGGAGSPTP